MMRYIIGTVFLLHISSAVCGAASGWYASDAIWALIYFLIAGYGTLALNHILKIRYIFALAATVIIAFVKEAGDTLYGAGLFGEMLSSHPFWDVRGMSLYDIGATLLSAVISYPFRKKI